MKRRMLIPALVVLGILAVSAGAYAAAGGGHSSLAGLVSLEATTTGTPEATTTGTPEATATGTVEPTGTAEGTMTATAEATGTPEATETPEAGPGNHEGGILGIPSDDSPACVNHGGCTIITTPSGNRVRVPNSPGHGGPNPGRGNANGNANGNGGGNDNGTGDGGDD